MGELKNTSENRCKPRRDAWVWFAPCSPCAPWFFKSKFNHGGHGEHGVSKADSVCPCDKIPRLRGERAFTLIEITIALFILATSLVILIGLEASLLGQAVSDRSRVEAMLVARRILAAMESSTDPLPTQQVEGNAKQLLEKFVENVGSEEGQDASIESLNGTFTVEDWGIPDNPSALKRITLTLAWSDNPSDTLTVYYFIPNEAEKVEDVEPVDSSTQ